MCPHLHGGLVLAADGCAIGSGGGKEGKLRCSAAWCQIAKRHRTSARLAASPSGSQPGRLPRSINNHAYTHARIAVADSVETGESMS